MIILFVFGETLTNGDTFYFKIKDIVMDKTLKGVNQKLKRKSTKGKAGRPYKVIDWDRVKYLCKVGCPGTEVAADLGMHHDTLYSAVKKEYKMDYSQFSSKYRQRGYAALRIAQYEAAIEDKDRGMMIWRGKNDLGQKDKQDITSNNETIKAPPIVVSDKEHQEMLKDIV